LIKGSLNTKPKTILTGDTILCGWYRFMPFVLLFVIVTGVIVSSLAANSHPSIKNDFYTLRQQCIHTLKNQNLLSSPKNVKLLTDQCLKFQKRYPASIYATRALYLSGMLWEGLYAHTGYVSEWNQSLKTYGKVVALYPVSRLADDALFRRGVLYLKMGLNRLALTEFAKLVKRYPHSDLRNVARAHIHRLSNSEDIRKTVRSTASFHTFVSFNGFRYWSNNRYARVVMDFSSKVPFQFKTFVTKGGTKLVFILDEPLTFKKRIQTVYGKHVEFFKSASLKKKRHSSSIAVSFRSKAQCRVFTLVSPYRIVVDALSLNDIEKKHPGSTPYKKTQDLIICLDPGHGGKDPGATGPHGIKEKDVVLRIARILREKLVKRYGLKVIMTRNRDTYIPLEERVAFANSKGADLFISIHINASRNRRVQGISTFCLSNTSDKKSLRLAARENGVPLSKMSSVNKILNDMLFCEKYNESYKVAHIIHQTLITNVRYYSPSINNLGVRFAPFYVLAGAKMPSILLELDFISNPYSEKRLVRYTYLNRITDGIAKGILKTTKTVNISRNFN